MGSIVFSVFLFGEYGMFLSFFLCVHIFAISVFLGGTYITRQTHILGTKH